MLLSTTPVTPQNSLTPGIDCQRLLVRASNQGPLFLASAEDGNYLARSAESVPGLAWNILSNCGGSGLGNYFLFCLINQFLP